MAYESERFRFPMGSAGRDALAGVREAVRGYMNFAPNEDLGERTPREYMRDAFSIIRRRLNDGWPIHSAAGAVENIAYSMADM